MQVLPRYIEMRGTTYRVRFPKSIWETRWFGSFDTLDEAVAARDRHLDTLDDSSEPEPDTQARNEWEWHRTTNGPQPSLYAFQVPLSASVEPHALASFPQSVSKPLEVALTIPTGDVLVIADLHVPHHSVTMLQRAVWLTRTRFPHIRTLAVIGDTWDWSSLSRHPKNAPYEDMNQALDMGASVYRTLGEHFDDIYVCNGNHDERVGLKLDAPFTLRRVFQSAFGADVPAAKMHISDLDYLHVECKNPWVIGHPSGYAGQGGKMGADIADIVGKNVACGHNHIVGLQPSRSGRYLGVDTGHMTDEASHYYKTRRLNKFGAWQAGFMILSQGFPHLFTERWTDWKSLGCPV